MRQPQDVPAAGQYGPWLLRALDAGWPGAPVGKRRRIEELAAKSGYGASTIYEDIGRVHPGSPERVAAVGKALRLLGAPKCSEFIALSYAGYLAMCIAIVGTYVAEEGETLCRALRDKWVREVYHDNLTALNAKLKTLYSNGPQLNADLIALLDAGMQTAENFSPSVDQVVRPAVMGVQATLRRDDEVDFEALAPIDLFVWRWLHERMPGRAVLEERLPPRFRAAYKTAKPFQPPDNLGLRSVMSDDSDLMQALEQLLPSSINDFAEVLHNVLSEAPSRVVRAQLVIDSFSKATGMNPAEVAFALREMASLDPAELKAFLETPTDATDDAKEQE